jgi:hypothetical protein
MRTSKDIMKCKDTPDDSATKSKTCTRFENDMVPPIPRQLHLLVTMNW